MAVLLLGTMRFTAAAYSQLIFRCRWQRNLVPGRTSTPVSRGLMEMAALPMER